MHQQDTILSPVNLSRRFLPFSKVDWLVLGIITFWVMVVGSIYGTLGGAAAVVVGVGLLWSQRWGKTYALAIIMGRDFVTRTVYQSTLWENVAGLSELGAWQRPAWWRRILQRLFRRRHPWPIRVDWMEDPLFGEVGVGYNSHDNTDSVVLIAEGSNVSGLTSSDYYAKLMAVGDAVTRASTGTKVSVAFIVRPRPPDVSQFDEAIDMSHHPDVVLPEVRILENQTGCDAEELYARGRISKEQLRQVRLNSVAIADSRASYSEHAREGDYTLILTMPRDPRIGRAARRRRAKPLSDQDVRRLPLTRALKVMHTALTNLGADNLRVLDRHGMEVLVANQRASSESNDTYSDRLPWYHPQVGIYGMKSMSVIDDVMCTVYRVTSMPRELGVHSISQLYTQTPSSVTFAALGENSRGGSEGSFLYWMTNIFDGLTENMRLGKSITRSREQLDTAADRISQSGHLQYMNILLAVSGTDPDQLEEDCDSLTRTALSLGFELELVPGSTMQLQARIAATTGMTRL